MRVIGIVGGIASGKSEVARRLARWGAVVLHADQLGHAVLAEPEVRAALRARFGDAVFHSDGSVHRSAVAARVFGDSPEHQQNREFLERLSHPRIRQLAQQQLDEWRRQSIPAVVLDAALLFEANWHDMCDAVLFVDAPDDQRYRRAAARGWSPAQLSARESAQAPLTEKRRRADWVFDNSRDLHYLYEQVDTWWQANIGTTLQANSPPHEQQDAAARHAKQS